MKIVASALTIGTLLLLSFTSQAQDVHVSPNAPKDTPAYLSEDEIKLLMPYIRKAQATYPDAKRRFQAGLPQRNTFFVTTRIMERQGLEEVIEQVFVAVTEISNGFVTGKVWNDTLRIKDHKKGDKYRFSEKDVIDWLITKPDGTEEGNFVGKFLDEYYKRR